MHLFHHRNCALSWQTSWLVNEFENVYAHGRSCNECVYMHLNILVSSHSLVVTVFWILCLHVFRETWNLMSLFTWTTTISRIFSFQSRLGLTMLVLLAHNFLISLNRGGGDPKLVEYDTASATDVKRGKKIQSTFVQSLKVTNLYLEQ